MERTSIGFTGESSRDLSVERLIEVGREAEARGFESIWIAEDYYYKDAISRLTALALSTKSAKLTTGVINPQTRSPPLIAMTMGTLDEISGGRMILGIGASLRLWLYEKHLPQLNHIKVITESVDIIRRLLAGNKISYDGSTYKLENLRLGFAMKRREIPIYLGAVGPKMIQLAGEIADGVLLTAGTTPEYVRVVRDNLRRGAEKAHRDPTKIDIASLVITSISDDRDKAREIVKEEIAFLSTLSRMDVVLEPSGLLDNKSIPKIRQAGLKGDMKEAARHVDDELIDALAVAGSTRECRQGIEKLRRAGVTQPVLVPMSSEMFSETLSELSPK